MPTRRKKRESGDGLAEEIRQCEGLLTAGNLTAEEEEKFRARINVMRLYTSESLPELRRRAKQSGLSKFWRGVDTETFVGLVADYLDHLNSGIPTLRWIVCEATLPVCAELGISDPAEIQEVVDGVSLVFSQAMLDELDRRQSHAETKDGQAVRRFLVEDAERGERLAALGRSATWRLWIPGDESEGGLDAQSEAAVEILEKLKDHLTASPPVLNKETLRAIVEGKFNSLLRKVRDAVRGHIETELRRSSHYVTQPARQASGEALIPLIETIADTKGSPADQDRLLFEISTHAGLTELERRVFLMVKLEGHTQSETAGVLAIKQPTVSRTLKGAIAKLKRAQGTLCGSPPPAR